MVHNLLAKAAKKPFVAKVIIMVLKATATVK
jgi:hypothetical protein